MKDRLPTPLRRSLLAPALVLACLAGSPLQASDSIDWKELKRVAPESLQEAAGVKRKSLILSTVTAGENDSVFLGFFISEDGTAICPLEPLCQTSEAEFQLAEDQRTKLEAPEVLAVLPERQIAVVKFDFTPEETLPFAADPSPLGTWAAILAPSFAGQPCLGPIVAHRPTSFTSPLKTQLKPAKRFSFAMNRNHDAKALIPGAPILNAEGEVIATFSGTKSLPGQMMRFGNPTLGLEATIEEAVEDNTPTTLPFSPKKETRWIPPFSARNGLN